MAPEQIRLSIGTAAVLGLINMRLKVPPTTAYIMSYTKGGCAANCAFCAQARDYAADRDKLSRVVWPLFNTAAVVAAFKSPAMHVLERICLQVINYPGFLEDTVALAELFRKETTLPISVDICPVSRDSLIRLKAAGVERVSIPLDGATPEIFNRIKGAEAHGPYRWESHMATIKDAVEIFGDWNVGSNLIVGLGETERDAAEFTQRLHDMNVHAVLFAFTPLEGTPLENQPPPDLESYRRVQAARHLITSGALNLRDLTFDAEGRITGYDDIDLEEALGDGEAFRTTGCPGCNRPFYNERPSGPFYNYPRPLSRGEAKKEIRKLGVSTHG